MEGSNTVLLVGTLDTKGAEYAYLRDRLRLHGVDSILADAGVNEPVGVEPDLHVGGDPAALAAAGDRGAAVTAMAEAAEELARRLYAEGRIGGVLAAGGSGGTAIATRAMQALPVGVPKLMVSTMAAGNTADYVGASDVTMMASVTDVAGVNSISGRILANAAGSPPTCRSGATPTGSLTPASARIVSTPCSRSRSRRYAYSAPFVSSVPTSRTVSDTVPSSVTGRGDPTVLPHGGGTRSCSASRLAASHT